MMKMSKLLININNLSEIEKYEEIGITNFLFAIDEFSIGYNSFSLNDIPDNSYVLINRVMDTTDIKKLKKIKNEFKRFKGIIFEDIGVYNIFKDLGIELIWFQNHFGTNHESINFWLDRCTSCVISNELTKEEVEGILTSTKRPLVLNVLGKNNIMYSRRTLLSNFNKYNNLSDRNTANIVENISNNNFLVKENKYGTVIFNNEYFNYLGVFNQFDDNILYYLVLNMDMSVSEIKDIIDGEHFGNDGFLNKKTVYRMSDYGKKQ